jgi:polyisoprenoid-binding protein YceI
MKLAFITLITLLSFASVAQKTNTKKIDIDLKQSKLEWIGKKLGGEHYGEIQLASGHLAFTKNKLTGGIFEMDMASITCVDITNEKSNKRLVDHLKSEDFFSVVRFPKSTFTITKVESKSATEYMVTGNLAIKGKANQITFTAKLNTVNNQTVAEATIVFDRSKYDVKFGSQSFFENIGDKLVYDDVDMNVKLVLITPLK